MEKQPFVTQNRSLAIALHTAGAPIMEVMNVYTPEMLKAWGFKSAAEAVNARKTGKLKFCIEPTDRLQVLIDAYNEQATRPENENFEIPDDVEDDIRAVRLVCHSQRVRKKIQECIDDPKHAFELHTKGTAEGIEKRVADALRTGKEMNALLPGFIVVNATASEQTRKRLGL